MDDAHDHTRRRRKSLSSAVLFDTTPVSTPHTNPNTNTNNNSKTQKVETNRKELLVCSSPVTTDTAFLVRSLFLGLCSWDQTHSAFADEIALLQVDVDDAIAILQLALSPHYKHMMEDRDNFFLMSLLQQFVAVDSQTLTLSSFGELLALSANSTVSICPHMKWSCHHALRFVSSLLPPHTFEHTPSFMPQSECPFSGRSMRSVRSSAFSFYSSRKSTCVPFDEDVRFANSMEIVFDAFDMLHRGYVLCTVLLHTADLLWHECTKQSVSSAHSPAQTHQHNKTRHSFNRAPQTQPHSIYMSSQQPPQRPQSSRAPFFFTPPSNRRDSHRHSSTNHHNTPTTSTQTQIHSPTQTFLDELQRALRACANRTALLDRDAFADLMCSVVDATALKFKFAPSFTTTPTPTHTTPPKNPTPPKNTAPSTNTNTNTNTNTKGMPFSTSYDSDSSNNNNINNNHNHNDDDDLLSLWDPCSSLLLLAHKAAEVWARRPVSFSTPQQPKRARFEQTGSFRSVGSRPVY